MRNNLLYIALNLTEISQNLLKPLVERTISEIGYDGDYKVYCHHMTVAYGEQITSELFNYSKEHEGQIYPIEIVSIGYSDKALAVQVKTECPSANAIKHVTLCTFGVGKPVDSNYIMNWRPLNTEKVLAGRLTFIYKK